MEALSSKLFALECKIKISKYKFFILVIMTSFFSFIYIDYFSFSSMGTFISLVIFFAVVLVSTFYSLSFGIILTLFLSLYIGEYPRDILNLYDEIQTTKTVTYNVLSSVTLIKFTLVNLLFMFNSVLAFFKIINFAFRKKHILVFSLFILIGFASLFMSLVFDFNYILKAVMSDFKFPLFSFSDSYFLT